MGALIRDVEREVAKEHKASLMATAAPKTPRRARAPPRVQNPPETPARKTQALPETPTRKRQLYHKAQEASSSEDDGFDTESDHSANDLVHFCPYSHLFVVLHLAIGYSTCSCTSRASLYSSTQVNEVFLVAPYAPGKAPMRGLVPYMS